MLRILGHRGAKGEAPENTIAGFIYAKELGLDAVEFDVRLARDGKLVVIHDATVDRTTNSTGKVAEFSSAELAALDARAGLNAWALPCGVPSLDQVLEIVADIPMMQIEIKHDTPQRLKHIVPLLVDTIKERDVIQQVVITSFDPVALEILRRIEPSYPAYSLLGSYDSMAWIERAVALQCTQVNVSILESSPEVVQRARELGLKLGGWVCNTAEDLERAQAMKLDCFTSDFPSKIFSLLSAERASSEEFLNGC